jgi:predicted Fe-Mo cluster-binding NifX family protein
MALAREMGVPFLGQIPIDPEVVMAGDAGVSLLHRGPPSSAAKAFSELVDKVLVADDQQRHPDSAEDGVQKKGHLKIVVPLAAGELSPRLGACDELALFEVDIEARRILGKCIHKASPHLPGVLPRRLHELGADVVLVAEMGEQAQQLLTKQGVKVVLDIQHKPMDDLVLEYLNEHAATCGAGEVA